jgi:hypothetical protein
MEKRLNTKIESYLSKFKQDIVEKIKEGISEAELISFVYEYNGFEVDNTDFQKRKRTNNAVPVCERCCAKRMNGAQCTRRKKKNSDYCGTHIKSTPHGIVEKTSTSANLKPLDLWSHEINGIMYYIDNNKNVYSTEDVLSNKTNPKIIANYEVSGDTYNIIHINDK